MHNTIKARYYITFVYVWFFRPYKVAYLKAKFVYKQEKQINTQIEHNIQIKYIPIIIFHELRPSAVFEPALIQYRRTF